jgi:hypothetical protein
MFTKAMYIERRGASLRALDAVIDCLTDHADRAASDVALNYYDVIQCLESTRANAAKKLRKLGAVSGEEWASADALRDVEHEWRALRQAVIVAISATYDDGAEE